MNTVVLLLALLALLAPAPFLDRPEAGEYRLWVGGRQFHLVVKSGGWVWGQRVAYAAGDDFVGKIRTVPGGYRLDVEVGWEGRKGRRVFYVRREDMKRE